MNLTERLDEAKAYVVTRYEDEEDKRYGLLASTHAKNLPGPWRSEPLPRPAEADGGEAAQRVSGRRGVVLSAPSTGAGAPVPGARGAHANCLLGDALPLEQGGAAPQAEAEPLS